MAGQWTAVIPVKPLAAAKSRLRGAVPAARHAELALALVRDTVAAALASSTVGELLVVTQDPTATAAVTRLGARVVPDPPGADLNAAIRFGADEVAGLRRSRVGLAGDLPALRPEYLDAALHAATLNAATPKASGGRSFVADAAGTGTVLLAAPPGRPLDPRFGTASATAHARSGATALTGEWPGLRQDVDTPADLSTTLRLGAGRYTRELLRDLDRNLLRVPAARAGNVPIVQGTIATYDPADRSGTLLLDDGTELAFSREAFDRSGLRALRPGQRVTIEAQPTGEIARVAIPGID